MPRIGAAAGEHVDRGDGLDEDARVAIGDAGDHRAEAALLCRAGEKGECGVALEHRLSAGPCTPIWKKWSMTERLKPPSSAVWAMAPGARARLPGRRAR